MFAAYLLMFCRIAIVLLFIFSASGKVLSLADFEVAIGDFKLLPRRWSKIVALLFLGGEIATVVFLTIDSGLLSIGFLLSITLLAVFSAALVTALQRNIGMSLSCNCFGKSERRISHYDVARNILLILCSLIGLWMLRYAPHPQVLAGSEVTLLGLMSAVFVVFVTNLGDVIETFCQPFSVNESGDRK